MVLFYSTAIVIALLIASSYTVFHIATSTPEDALHHDSTSTGGTVRIRTNEMGQESIPIQQIDGSWDLALKFADTFDLPAGLLLFPRDDESDEENDSHHLNNHQTHTLFPRSDSNSTTNNKNSSSSPTPLETYRAISNVVFGIQVAGSLTAENQRNYLCNNNNFKMNPIEGLGLNYDKLKQVICTDIPASQIPLDNKTVADSLQLYNAMLWLQMTFNVFFGNATKLCDMFNVQQAEKVGMDAINIMWYLCMVAYPHGRG